MLVLLVIETKGKQVAYGEIILLYESLNCHLTPFLIFIFGVHERSHDLRMTTFESNIQMNVATANDT